MQYETKNVSDCVRWHCDHRGKETHQNMYLRIKKEDGMVLISAPYQMSDLRIRRFAEERLPWIREYQKKYKELKQQNDLKPALSEAEIRRRKVLLKAAVEKLIQKYEPLMQVQVSGVTIRQMKTRWGSCNVKHIISTSIWLFMRKDRSVWSMWLSTRCVTF